jgi:hypothetical protein
MTGSLPPGFPIRTSPDLRSRAAPRSFSQLATSFLAGPCLGIHHCALTRLTSFPFTLSQSIHSRISSPLQASLAHRFLLLLYTRHTQAILRAGIPPKRSKKGIPRLPICSHNPEHFQQNPASPDPVKCVCQSAVLKKCGPRLTSAWTAEKQPGFGKVIG